VEIWQFIKKKGESSDPQKSEPDGAGRGNLAAKVAAIGGKMTGGERKGKFIHLKSDLRTS